MWTLYYRSEESRQKATEAMERGTDAIEHAAQVFTATMEPLRERAREENP